MCQAQLNNFPLVVQTPLLQRRVDELNSKLKEIDAAKAIFSRARVRERGSRGDVCWGFCRAPAARLAAKFLFFLEEAPSSFLTWHHPLSQFALSFVADQQNLHITAVLDGYHGGSKIYEALFRRTSGDGR